MIDPKRELNDFRLVAITCLTFMVVAYLMHQRDVRECRTMLGVAHTSTDTIRVLAARAACVEALP